MKYLVKIQYSGKNFSGYQRQSTQRTVQGEVEKALSEVLKEKIEILSSSRTDAGVGAYALPAHFQTSGLIPPHKLPFAVNQMLPDDVKIISCKEVGKVFNARRDVKKKVYQYNLYVYPHILPLFDETAYQLKKMPNLSKMRIVARAFVGTHNFKAFSSVGGQSNSTIKKIFWIKIKKLKNQITLTVCGNSFLYNMVRIIAGTIIYAGYGKIKKSDVKLAFKNLDRNLAGIVAPSKALFLKEVIY